MIGAGVRIDGKVAFTGVLRVQGEIQGDVSCPASSHDAIVIDGSGGVTGAIAAPHIVIKGRVLGPMISTQTIEIHPGAHVVGDAVYRHLDVHAGGVIDGLMTPGKSDEQESPLDVDSDELPPPPVIKEFGAPLGAGNSLANQLMLFWKPVVAGVVAIAVGSALWFGRESPKPVSRESRADHGPLKADEGLKTEVSRQLGMASSIPASGTGTPPATANSATALSGTESEQQGEDSSSVAARSTRSADKVVTVEGVNPSKPVGVFLLVTKEPSVLYKKRLDDSSQGQRIEMAAGEKVSIAIASDELLRVAKGHDVSVFYQGRKVPPKIIESGEWMKLVPHPGSRNREDR